MTGGIERHRVVSVVETLLLVDGDEGCRSALKFLLELSGYRVVEAARGIEASQLLEEHGDRIHMVLLAADLPDMTAPEWTSNARVIAPGLPVIVLKERDRLEAFQAPADPVHATNDHSPAPIGLLETLRMDLDEHLFARYCPVRAA